MECARLLLPVSDLGIISPRMGGNAFHASVMNASKECFELLLPLVDVDIRTTAGVDLNGNPVACFVRTALHNACLKSLFDFVKALVRAGASLMAKDCESATPCIWLRRKATSPA